MNINLQSRLYNFKFKQARMYLENESEEVKDLINTLAMIFGDCGGMGDSFSLIVRHALENIGVTFGE